MIIIRRQWVDLGVPSCPSEVQKREEGQCVCSTALSCQQYGIQTSDRTPGHRRYSLGHDWEWHIVVDNCVKGEDNIKYSHVI